MGAQAQPCLHSSISCTMTGASAPWQVLHREDKAAKGAVCSYSCQGRLCDMLHPECVLRSLCPTATSSCSLGSTSAALNHEGCSTWGKPQLPPPPPLLLSQGQEALCSPHFSFLAPLKHSSNSIFQRAAHESNSPRGCTQLGSVGGTLSMSPRHALHPDLLALPPRQSLAPSPPRSLPEQILPTDQRQTFPLEAL